MIFVAVNLDPFEAHEAEIEFPLHAMSIPEDETFEVEELLDGAKHLWRGQRQHVRLDPHANPAAIFRVNPCAQVDYRSPCFYTAPHAFRLSALVSGRLQSEEPCVG